MNWQNKEFKFEYELLRKRNGIIMINSWKRKNENMKLAKTMREQTSKNIKKHRSLGMLDKEIWFDEYTLGLFSKNHRWILN